MVKFYLTDVALKPHNVPVWICGRLTSLWWEPLPPPFTNPIGISWFLQFFPLCRWVTCQPAKLKKKNAWHLDHQNKSSFSSLVFFFLKFKGWTFKGNFWGDVTYDVHQFGGWLYLASNDTLQGSRLQDSQWFIEIKWVQYILHQILHKKNMRWISCFTWILEWLKEWSTLPPL